MWGWMFWLIVVAHIYIFNGPTKNLSTYWSAALPCMEKNVRSGGCGPVACSSAAGDGSLEDDRVDMTVWVKT
jgi:hypothetical protein